jgi:hypothetical protein
LQSYDESSGDSAIKVLWQQAPGDWRTVPGLSESFSSDVVAGTDTNGILRVFYVAPDGVVIASRNTACIP